jgi:GMP synthase-like glutamine amidotransferase
MAVNEGLTVFNLVDGVVDEFHDESGTDEAEGSNDLYNATCDYINDFSAIVAKDNFIGVQFHPEKSGSVGSLILQNFLDLVYSPEKVSS